LFHTAKLIIIISIGRSSLAGTSFSHKMAKKINFLLIRLDKKVLRCEDTIALGLSNVDQGSNDDEHAENAVSWLISKDLVEDFKRDTGDVGGIHAHALRGELMTTGKKRKKEEEEKKDEHNTAVVKLEPVKSTAIKSMNVQEWAQCDVCDKWRKLPLDVDPSTLPTVWICSMNTLSDPSRNCCNAPQEEETTFENAAASNRRDDMALTTANQASTTTINNSTKRKSTTTSSTDGRSSRKAKKLALDKYQLLLTTGANMYGPAKTNEDKCLRTIGVEAFNILRRLHDGTCRRYAVPFVLALKRDSPRALKLLREGKKPQVAPKNLKPGERLKFHCFKIKETPDSAVECYFRTLATALEVKDYPDSRQSKESRLRTVIFKRNNVLQSSKNPLWGGKGTQEAKEKRKRQEYVFFMKDCCDKRSVTFFGEEGRTLRWYYTRNGNWNRQFIESLENDKKTNELFKALLFEEGKKSIDELEF